MISAPTVEETGRLPLVIYVLAVGVFLMGTTEFVVAGILPEIAVTSVRRSRTSA